MKYIISISLIWIISQNAVIAQPKQVCFSEQEAVDIITLLDSSERDLQVISDCQLLVKDLYKEVEDRENKVKILTTDLIDAKKDIIKYRADIKRWKKITWYSGLATVAMLAIQILPKVL